MLKIFRRIHLRKRLLIGLLSAASFFAIILYAISVLSQDVFNSENSTYVIFGMNDLGMHCYQKDFSGFLILPPGNNIKVQIVRNEGKTAELVNSGIEVYYQVVNNSDSTDRTNFWEFAKDYGYDVPPNIGITGNGLQGVCTLSADKKYYVATAIPVTPYADGSDTFDPYQMVRITVKDLKTGDVLAETADIVVPVSDEMLCSSCHGIDNTDINILKAHDELSRTNLAESLNEGERYKCADCHRDNILGEKGKADVLPLSEAMHGFHADKMSESDIEPVCYNCHPGPVTQCQRGRMFLAGISCDNTDCHGDMANVAKTQAMGRQAWLQEPDCAVCHGALFGVNTNTLYRNSYLMNAPGVSMNGLIQCESCHNSTHAEWLSSLPKDNLLPASLQGFEGYIQKCSVCHQGEGKMHTKQD